MSAPPNPYGAPDSELPQHLNMAPQDRRIDETFGFFPGAFALAAVFGIIGTIVSAIIGGGFDNMEQMYWIGGGVVAAVLFAFWEFWRRMNPTSLVVMGGRIGLYRKGVLDMTITASQMTWFRLNFANSLREYMLFGFCGLALPGGAVSFASGSFGPGIWMIGLGLGGCLAFASSVWSRGMCFHYYVPKGGGTETVVLPKSKLRRLGNWPFPV